MTTFTGLFFIWAWVAGYVTQMGGGSPFIPLDLAALLLLVAHRPDLRTIKRSRIAAIAAVLFLSWLFSLRLIPLRDSLFGLMYLMRFVMYFFVFSFSWKALRSIRSWIIVGFYGFVIFGLLQYLGIPDTRFLFFSGWDRHYFRLIGTMLDPNYEGVMLGILGIFGIFKFQKTKSSIWAFLSFISLIGLIFTFSRASWIATGIGLLVLLQRLTLKANKKSLFVFFVFMISLVIFVISPKPGGEGVNLARTTSITERVKSWTEGFTIWTRHPWFGIGFNNYRLFHPSEATYVASGENRAANSPSSSWLLLLSTLGVFGVPGIFWIAGKEISAIWSERPMWLSIIAVVAVHAFFNNTFFYAPLWGLLLLIRASTES